MLSKQHLILWLILCLPLFLLGQSYTTNDPLINDCTGVFFDAGGLGGSPYPETSTQTTTICSDGSAGTHVRLDFSNVDIANGDTLFFYDGMTAQDPLIATNATFGSSVVTAGGQDSLAAAMAFIIQATVENTSGCITVVFQPNNDGVAGSGWEAILSCGAACQNIFVELTGSDPPIVPVDTGYIDLCPGQEFSISAVGIYPQSGIIYPQNDALTTFDWTMDNGDVVQGPSITYSYDEPGGYVVQLVTTDQNGCRNLNLLTQRVRVAPPPQFTTQGLPPICIGDTISLTASTSAADQPNVLVEPSTSGFPIGGIRSDSLALPDGLSSYRASVLIADFPEGKILQQSDDVESICINMEHSYLYDLSITITCPNGQSVNMQETNFLSGAEPTLGIPYEGDDGQNTGDDMHLPGIGFDYCFSADAATSWDGYIDQNGPGQLPAGDYLPLESLDGLIGCPLNGEWTLEVADGRGNDNGWVFEWSINFAKRVLPFSRSFTPAIVDYSWVNNPEIDFYTADSISTFGSSAGDINYVLTATDDFGCSWDTSIIARVLPNTHPDCYECTDLIERIDDVLICNPAPRELDVTKNDLQFETPVNYIATPQASIGFSNAPPATPFASTINVSGVAPMTLSDPAVQFTSVCVDLQTDRLGDIELFLQAPSGQRLELTTQNGGDDVNGYTQVCFTPTATNVIDLSFPPFTGNYLPEGDFADLIGATIEGDWTLLVSDENGPGQGTLESWSITFQSINEITYSWSPSFGLSCDDCPNPSANPFATTNYVVTASDLFGCTDRDTIIVALASDLPEPVIGCEITANGEVTFNWQRIENFGLYDIRFSRNSVTDPWIGPITDLSFVVDNLNLLDTVSLDLRVFADPNAPSCDNPEVRATCVYTACVHEAQIVEVTPVTCSGNADGTLRAMGTNGAPPYLYFLDGSTTSQDSGFFTNLSAGAHTLIVQDQTGCQDTTFFDVPTPLPLTASIELEKAVSCPDGNDGILRAMVTGGTGEYTYSWAGLTQSDTSTVVDLTPGTYEVNVVDENNCPISATFTLDNPEGMQLSLVPIPPSCADTQDGAVTTNLTGGTPGYTFLWDTGATIAEPNDFGPGQHCLTVTDARGCQETMCITIDPPTPVVIDSVGIVAASCFGTNTGSAIVFTSGGTGTYNYTWSDDLQQISQEAVRLEAGSYTVLISDANSCTVSTNVVIPQPDPLTAVVTPQDATCFDGTDGEASAQISGGTGPFSFAWPSGGSNMIEVGLATGSYEVSITDANNCETTAAVFIGQPANAVAVTAVQTDQGCFGMGDNTVEASAIGGSGTGYTFSWNDPNQQTGPTAVNLDSNIYVVTAMDSQGCIGTDTIDLSDLPPISIGIIANAPSCPSIADGQMGVNLILGGSGGNDPSNYSLVWSTGQTGLTIANLAGNLEYSVTATDTRGCVGMETRFLPQPDTIAFDLAVVDVSCTGGNDGSAEVSNLSGPGNQFTINWGAAAGGQTGESASSLSAGNYVVTITDDGGCANMSSVRVNEPTPIEIDFQKEEIACFGGNEGSISAGASGGTPDYTFTWSNNLPAGPNVNNIPAGTYTLTVTDANSCQTATSITIEQPATVQLNLSVTDVTCFGDRDGRIEIQTLGGTPPYQYSTDNLNFNGISTIIGLEAGSRAVYVRDAAGCLYSEAVTIENPPEFLLDIGPDITINLGDTVNLSAEVINAAGGIADLFWSAPYEGTLSCEQCDGPSIWPQNTIFYKLTGYDSNGCEAEDQIRVIVEKPRTVLVPSGFTPNNDQVNDRLLVHGREGTQIKVFRIFDRWGELLYEKFDFPVNDPSVGWDGTFRGQFLNSGVYIWYLEAIYPFDQQEESFKGQTTLIRQRFLRSKPEMD